MAKRKNKKKNKNHQSHQVYLINNNKIIEVNRRENK